MKKLPQTDQHNANFYVFCDFKEMLSSVMVGRAVPLSSRLLLEGVIFSCESMSLKLRISLDLPLIRNDPPLAWTCFFIIEGISLKSRKLYEIGIFFRNRAEHSLIQEVK